MLEARPWEAVGWAVDDLDRELQGKDVVVQAPTGAGKTLAGFLPTLVELTEQRAKPARLVSTGRDLKISNHSSDRGSSCILKASNLTRNLRRSPESAHVPIPGDRRSSKLAPRRAAAVMAGSADVRFVCRYREDITEEKRLVWRGEPYDIRSVADIEGARVALEILGSSRVGDAR